MTFPTYFRPVNFIVISLSVLLSSGCLTIKSTKRPQETQPVHDRHFSKIIYPAADRRPYVETKNAQLGKMRWLVDSGATHSVIFDNGKKSLEAIITKSSESKNNVHGMFSTESKKLSLFSYRAEGVPTLTGYTMDPHGQQLRSRADGILGMNSLQLHDAVMLPRQKLLLWNSRGTHFGKGAKINLRRHSKSSHLIATVYHGVHTLYLIVDTGASKSVISADSSQKIQSAYKSRVIRLSGVHQSRSNNMRINKLKIRFTPSETAIKADFIVTDLSNLRKSLNSTNDVHIDGVLGYDLLSRYCHAIDFGRGFIYLSKN